MRFPKTLSALAIVAILAPVPAAASSLTADGQRRPAKPMAELRQRMADRRGVLAERQQQLRAEQQRRQALRGQRQLRPMRLRMQLKHTLRVLRLRIARHRAIRRGF